MITEELRVGTRVWWLNRVETTDPYMPVSYSPLSGHVEYVAIDADPRIGRVAEVIGFEDDEAFRRRLRYDDLYLQWWVDIAPADATSLDLSVRTDILAPFNDGGERCPWPWDPQQLGGQPIGQYHCRYCGAMVIAGVPHIDYGPEGF